LGGAGAEPGLPTIVFHGDGDKTVNPRNGDQVIDQAAAGRPLAQSVSEGLAPHGVRFTRTVRADAAGRPVLEHWRLHGTGHAWAGGSAAGSYTDERGPDAS